MEINVLLIVHDGLKFIKRKSVLHTYIKERFENEIPKCDGYLKNSYENILAYIKETEFKNDITKFLLQTYERDMRRGVNATKVFPKLFEELDAYPLDKFN